MSSGAMQRLARLFRITSLRFGTAAAVLALLGAPGCASTAFGNEAGCVADSCAADVRDAVPACDGSSDDPTRCGPDCRVCPAPPNGIATCVAATCAFECSRGYVNRAGACVPVTARPVHPMSNARVSVRNPTLRWAASEAVTSVRISICRDRACAMPEMTFDATGDSARVPRELPEETWFWHVTPLVDGVAGATSATWTFHTPAVSGPIEWARCDRPDYNGDGIDDFSFILCDAVSHGASAFVLGDRSERFSLQTLNERTGISVGDVNADGYTDYLNFVSGVFAGGDALEGTLISAMLTWYPVNAFEYQCGIGDFDRDGFVDSLGFSDLTQGHEPAIAYGNGNGWGVPTAIPNGFHLGPMVIDLDADGYDDLIFGNGLTWYRGGPAGLGSSQPIATPNARGDSFVVSVGDITGDGYPDAARWYENDDRILTITGGPAPSELPARRFGGPTYVFGTIGDLNGDGRIDLLTRRSSTNENFVLFGAADGYVPGAGAAVVLPCNPAGLQDIRTVGDVNADGQLDAGLFCNAEGRMFVLLNQRSGSPRAIELHPPSPTLRVCGMF